MAIDGVDGALWAVGYVRRPSSLRPLVVRKRSPRGWHVVPTPARRAGATLTDVAVDRSAGTWAVGYTIGQPGHHRPWVLRWDGRQFVDRSPALRRGERGRLTAASASAARRHVDRGLGPPRRGRPPVHRASERRSVAPPARSPTSGRPPSPTSTCPSRGLAGRSGTAIWPTGLEPLVLRWDGAGWTSLDTSAIADDPALLLGSWTRGRRAGNARRCRLGPPSARFEGLTARGGSRRLVAERAREPRRARRASPPSTGRHRRRPGWRAVARRSAWRPGRAQPRAPAGAGRRTTRERRRRQGAAATASTPRVVRARVHAADERPRPAAGLGPAPRLRITPAAGPRPSRPDRGGRAPALLARRGVRSSPTSTRTARTTSSSGATGRPRGCSSTAARGSSTRASGSATSTATGAPRATSTAAGCRTCTARSGAGAARE